MRDALGAVGTILVLGGTSEIGLAIARRLADARTQKVILAGRSPERMAAAGAGLPGVACETWDMADADGHEEFLRRVAADHGDLDVVILAAGVLGDDLSAAEVLRVNTLGAGAACVAAGDVLRDQGHGALIVLSSVAGERVRRSNYVYGASKAGLDGLAQGMADRLAGSGVRVLVVRPGFVKTQMTAHLDAAPLSTTADAVAERVAAALARGAHTVWAPPAMRYVMLVLRLLPRPIFRRLNF